MVRITITMMCKISKSILKILRNSSINLIFYPILFTSTIYTATVAYMLSIVIREKITRGFNEYEIEYISILERRVV